MSIHPLNVLDGLIIITIGWNLVRGFNKGFVEELLSLAGIFASLWFAFYASHPVAEKLVNNPTTSIVAITGIAIYLITFLIFKYIAFNLNKKLAQTSLGLVNNFLGFVFGIFRGYVISAIIVFGLAILTPNSYLIKNSYLGGAVVPVIDRALHYMPELSKKKIIKRWETAKDFLVENFNKWRSEGEAKSPSQP